MDCVLEAQQTALIFAAGGGLILSSPAILAIEGGCLLALGISCLFEHLQKNKNKPQGELPTSKNGSHNKSNSDSDQKKNSSQPPEDPKKDNKPPHGIYSDAPYHHKNSGGRKNPAPKVGQKALDNSLQIDPPASRRIGISEGEIVILDRTVDGIFHGHVRTWSELIKNPCMQKACNLLRKSNLVDKFGRIV